MTRLLALAGFLLFVAGCPGAAQSGDGGTTADGGAVTTGCLERPGALPGAPNSGLSCELIPPTVTLQAK